MKKISCLTFFVDTNFTKIENHFIFEMLKKKIWSIFRRILELLTQKFVIKLSKILVWDPGDRKKTYSGSRIQGSKRHRIPDLDPSLL